MPKLQYYPKVDEDDNKQVGKKNKNLGEKYAQPPTISFDKELARD